MAARIPDTKISQQRRWQLAMGLLGLVGLLAAVLGWQRLALRRGGRSLAVAASADGTTGRVLTTTSAEPALAAGRDAAASERTADSPAAVRALARQRLQRAQERLAAFRTFARYPPDSRPASEQPDRLQPTAPVMRTLRLPLRGKKGPEVTLRLVQDRVQLVGSESARLSVRCEDSGGAPFACSVLSAHAVPLSATATSGLPAPVPAPLNDIDIHFTDDGRGADEAGGDGTLTALVQPARLGFGAYLGPLRIELTLRGGDAGELGEALFDLFYTPEPPAVLTSQVREALEDGSLSLYLGIDVRTAGRYELAARVDDMSGKSFAYLQWSGELAAGDQEIRLVVFGKLIRDAAPAMPLRLRDVDGFLTKEKENANASADSASPREHLPMLAGYIHTTDRYASSAFSDSEWQGDMRSQKEQLLIAEIDDALTALAAASGPNDSVNDSTTDSATDSTIGSTIGSTGGATSGSAGSP